MSKGVTLEALFVFTAFALIFTIGLLVRGP
jgi:hypothetical protein